MTSLGGLGCSPPSLVVPVVFEFGEFSFCSSGAVFFFLLLLGVPSALAAPPGCVCSACLGTPAVVPLRVRLTQVGCSTPAVLVLLGVGGCVVTVVLFPPCFLFCAWAASPSAASPSGFCPLPEWIGMSVSSLLVYSSVWLEGSCCDFFLSACALFSLLAGTLGFSGLLLLRLLAGVVGALHPVSGCSSCGVVCLVCCLFLTFEWVYFWLRCLQSLWATKVVSAALRGSSSSSGVCWSISFFWSWGGFWSRVTMSYNERGASKTY